MRTTRLRERIKRFLAEKGEANTTEILEHVNTTTRHGTTPQQLGNVLSKDKDIEKVSTTKRGGALSGRYDICVSRFSFEGMFTFRHKNTKFRRLHYFDLR